MPDWEAGLDFGTLPLDVSNKKIVLSTSICYRLHRSALISGTDVELD
ncbi:hypothetical protein D1AOALGA4SA_11213 [Olavius algarvensis Delta 1 endosymbiont]|nr:hypothetical protein D1AOALGA4SA_11213 [Olavius algarvensis Delta 1 endosymbiont]